MAGSKKKIDKRKRKGQKDAEQKQRIGGRNLSNRKAGFVDYIFQKDGHGIKNQTSADHQAIRGGGEYGPAEKGFRCGLRHYLPLACRERVMV